MSTVEGPTRTVQPVHAPTSGLGILKQLGPGLIISAVIVGSGELIVTPKLGASAGFTLLWFMILGCLLKVFVQVELGRFTISRGMTTLEAMNSIPGPRFIVSWLVWLWVLMYFALVFQVAGMVGGIAKIFALANFQVPQAILGILICSVTAILLVVGRYRLIESLSTALVALFTLSAVIAVCVLQTTPYAITSAQLLDGFKFHLPESINVAFAAFGVVGVGASELIYYPYWCLEKGYAKNVGPDDGSTGWVARARGWLHVMNIDAWTSFAIYTTTTIAFYLLGAAVLHSKGLIVEDSKMVETLSHMYRETFGPWSLWMFLVGAFCVLYSTVFGATASNARLFADALSLFGVVEYRTAEDRTRMVKVGCVVLSVAILAVFLIWGNPVSLVLVGAIAQGMMVPFLAIAAVYFYHCRTSKQLLPGKAWAFCLWISTLSMTALGLYQIINQFIKK